MRRVRLAIRQWTSVLRTPGQTARAAWAAVLASLPWITGVVTAVAVVATTRRWRARRWLRLTAAVSMVRLVAVRQVGSGSQPGRTRKRSGVDLSIRVVTQNVWSGHRDVVGICTELRDFMPTLVVLQEITHDHVRRIDESGVFDKFPFREARPHDGHAGLGAWSRFPLESSEWIEVAGEVQLRVWIRGPGTRMIRAYGVHAPSPMPVNVARWSQWFNVMAYDVSQELALHDHPLIVLGDFNATVDHAGFRGILRAGLTDAAARPRGFSEMTWPRRWAWVPTLFRVDHVLVTGDVPVLSHRVGEGTGSDHRPVMAELGLTRSHAPLICEAREPDDWRERERECSGY
jgi:endonuclease/exonuclease/phosphatase (EEP) superfamily protein YafD